MNASIFGLAPLGHQVAPRRAHRVIEHLLAFVNVLQLPSEILFREIDILLYFRDCKTKTLKVLVGLSQF